MLKKKTWCSLLIVGLCISLQPRLQAAEEQRSSGVDLYGLFALTAAVPGAIATALLGVFYWQQPTLECEDPRVRYMNDSSARRGPGCPGHTCYWPDSIPLPPNVSRTADGSCQNDARLGFAALYVFVGTVAMVSLAGIAKAISSHAERTAHARAQRSGPEIELGILPAIEGDPPSARRETRI